MFGGILKGATGVGAPFLAVPIMAVIMEVPFAVAVFLIPNIISNSWQIWRFRKHVPHRRFVATFALTGVVGAGVGTVALAHFSSSLLTGAVAVVVLAYVAFRLFNPGWSLAWDRACQLGGVVGGVGGFFQGSLGLSGPISVTFMNAVGLERKQFIVTMSIYFLAMAMIQLPVQIGLGIMTLERMGYGFLALIPLGGGMAIGDVLARYISKASFDRIIFAILTLLALRLLAESVF